MKEDEKRKQMNKATLLGNIGADPELRMTASGQARLTIRLATSRKFHDANKQLQERTEWHSVVVWGRRAEGLARFLAKGMKICVEGRIEYRSYEKDGQTKYITEILALEVFACDKREGSGQRREAPQREQQDDGFGKEYQGYASDNTDDIPF